MSAVLGVRRRQQFGDPSTSSLSYQTNPTSTTIPSPHYSSSSLSSTSLPLHSETLPFRSHPSQFLSPIPSEADIARLSHSPFSTTESSPATSTVDLDTRSDYYMQRTSQDLQNSSQRDSRHPSLESVGIHQTFWNQQQPRNSLAAQRIRHSIPPGIFHKRTNSDSTIHSAPYTPTSLPQFSYQPYIVDSESQQYSPHSEIFDHHQQSVTSVPKSYSQVSQPSNHHIQAFAQNHQSDYYNHAQSQLHWNEAMREAILHQQHQQQFHAPVYSTMENHGDMNASVQEKLQPFSLAKVPGLGPRTVSAAYEDELWNPADQSLPAQVAISNASRLQADGSLSSPVNSVFSQRLQAANQGHLDAARSASPTTSTFSGDKSPFRPRSVISGSPYDPPTSPIPPMTAAQLREAQRAEAAHDAFANATRRTSREGSQTVSPKEVSLDFDGNELENQQRMFGSPNRPSQHQKRPSGLHQELSQTSTYDGLISQDESSNVSNDTLSSNSIQHIQVPQQYPFIRTHQPSTSGLPESSQESNPRFPSTLISMESTKSERSERSERSSSSHSPEVEDAASEDDDVEEEDDEEGTQGSEVSRPNNTRSDGGTYTCTYHGCSQRFETPQKLQKHKKEGHRQGTPSTNADSRMTQSGPHTCNRTNPQTGKPCNSVFSRPYDLTRHEDTIHNARKQKVKCMICTEDKSFSRNDALTRHMRVVHPEIDFPGKTKRGSR